LGREILWRKPAACAAGHCVEVAAADHGWILVRQSSAGEVLSFTRDEFAAFVDAATAGEYDDLCEPL
jgi:hypothetical protein